MLYHDERAVYEAQVHVALVCYDASARAGGCHSVLDLNYDAGNYSYRLDDEATRWYRALTCGCTAGSIPSSTVGGRIAKEDKLRLYS